MPDPDTYVGRVAGIWRYPVKSMAAESLVEAEVSWHGLAGDRRWAYVREEAAVSGFPWLTLRERADLNAFVPSFLEPARPDRSPVVVRTPAGRCLDVADPALAAELGDGLRAIRQDRGIFDTFPLSLITAQSIAALAPVVGEPLDVRRFRPNVLVEAADGGPFPEDAWVGRVLRVGGVRLRVDKRDGRCAIVTVDPDSGGRTPGILRAIASERGGCLGVYGSVVEPGRIALGDPVLFASGA